MSTKAAMAAAESHVRSLFDQIDDKSVVVGLQSNFEYNPAVRSASTVRLATAFAHIHGWKLIEEALCKSSASLKLLTGLDCLQTEPKLLHRWFRLANNRANLEAKLASKLAMFHPKVLIVTGPTTDDSFAIVGSGNLSMGGLRTNTECAIYVSDESTVAALSKWFDEQWRQGRFLGEAEIGIYEKRYNRAAKMRKQMRAEESAVQSAIERIKTAEFRERAGAVAAVKKLLASDDFARGYKKRKEAATRITQLLDIPRFDFDEVAWKEFFKIRELGYLIPIRRDGLYKQKQRLQDGLRFLFNEDIPIQKRLGELLERSGRYHIEGLGPNLVTKILTVSNPLRWAVYNTPVDVILRSYGYTTRRGLRPAER